MNRNVISEKYNFIQYELNSKNPIDKILNKIFDANYNLFPDVFDLFNFAILIRENGREGGRLDLQYFLINCKILMYLVNLQQVDLLNDFINRVFELSDDKHDEQLKANCTLVLSFTLAYLSASNEILDQNNYTRIFFEKCIIKLIESDEQIRIHYVSVLLLTIHELNNYVVYKHLKPIIYNLLQYLLNSSINYDIKFFVSDKIKFYSSDALVIKDKPNVNKIINDKFSGIFSGPIYDNNDILTIDIHRVDVFKNSNLNTHKSPLKSSRTNEYVFDKLGNKSLYKYTNYSPKSSNINEFVKQTHYIITGIPSQNSTQSFRPISLNSSSYIENSRDNHLNNSNGNGKFALPSFAEMVSNIDSANIQTQKMNFAQQVIQDSKLNIPHSYSQNYQQNYNSQNNHLNPNKNR